MKKFLSILIAMLLIVSLFATTAVAFAEETGEANPPATGEGSGDTPTDPDEGETEEPERNVTVNVAELKAGLAIDCAWFNNLKIEMGDVKFGESMMKDSAVVAKAFPGINYVVDGDENYKEEKDKNDKIIVEYCRPSESPKGQKTWQNSTNIKENIRISSSGWYLFRFVVKDSKDNVLAISNSQYTTDGSDYYIGYYAEDTSRPVVSLSTTMKNKVDSGLTAETKYSIPTSGLTNGSSDEMSSTTVNFQVFKVVGGKDVLIYDSKTKEITEGYKDFVDTDGAITPSKADISDSVVYKVKYFVTDAYGFTGVESKDDQLNYAALEFNPVMELKVVAPVDNSKKNSVNVWEIVLFCIAGLSAVGIVVLLCIKPKDASAVKAANAPAQEDDAAEQTDETQE